MFDSDLFPNEVDILVDLVSRHPDTVYLELGVFQGGTFRKILERTNAYCIGIDLFEDFVPNEKNTHVSGTIKKSDLENELNKLGFTGRYELIKGDTSRSISELSVSKKHTVVFVDGNHTFMGCLRDCLACALYVMDKGYMVLHNASETYEPDKTYIQNDGGPFAVAKRLSELEDVKYIGLYGRSAVLEILTPNVKA